MVCTGNMYSKAACGEERFLAGGFCLADGDSAGAIAFPFLGRWPSAARSDEVGHLPLS